MGMWYGRVWAQKLAMKGVNSAPGDYIYFKSQVPLHKIPVRSVYLYFSITLLIFFPFSYDCVLEFD